MAGFDPIAATAAYMATLSPAEHQRAIDYTQGGHWLLLWGWLVGIVAALLILRSGVLVALRGRLDPDGGRPKRAAFLVAVAFLLIDAAIELPWVVYSGWWRERSYALSTQAFGGWLGEWLIGLAISTALSGLFFLALYTLVRRRPASWWLWSAGVAIAGIVVVLIVQPVVIEPLFNSYTPAPAGPMRDAVVDLARATGVPHDRIYIYDGSKQSERYTANVAGLGSTARVAMSDVMFKRNADRAEVIGVVGHEMGHYMRGHIFILTLVMSVVALAFFRLVDRLFPVVWRRVDPTRRVTGLADPAGLPIVLTIISTLGLLATPLLNTLTRMTESDADRFSLIWAHEPDGLSKALVKTIAYRASSPSALEEAVFYDHPSVERRVRRAMEWKAAHPRGVGIPPGLLPAGE